jgi:hypothetical protein
MNDSGTSPLFFTDAGRSFFLTCCLSSPKTLVKQYLLALPTAFLYADVAAKREAEA